MTPEERAEVVSILITFKTMLTREPVQNVTDPILRAQVTSFLVARMDRVEYLIQKLSQI